jgi:hypothetical protein
MVDEVFGPPLANRHLQRVQHQFGAQMFAIAHPTILRLQASSTTAR